MDKLKLGIASVYLGFTGMAATTIGAMNCGEIKDIAPIEQQIEELEEYKNWLESQDSSINLTPFHSQQAGLYHEAALINDHNDNVYNTRHKMMLVGDGLGAVFILIGLYRWCRGITKKPE